MVQKTLLVLAVFLLGLSKTQVAPAQQKAGGSPVEWYTLEQAMQLRKKAMRPLFIHVYTNWCGWCKKMMKTTFSNPEIASYLNSRYYPVRLDAQTRDTIQFKGKTYVNNEQDKRPMHALAKKLLNNRMNFPTQVIMDRQGDQYPIPGYIEPKDGLPLAAYFAEGNHRAVKFKEYRKHYKTSQQKGIPQNDTLIQWLSLDDAIAKNQKEPRGIFLLFYTSWNVSSAMLQKSTLNHPVIGKHINQNFYPVKINATTRDTLQFGKTYYNTGNKPSYHQLPAAMLKGKMQFPAMLFLNQESKLMQTVQHFMTPEDLEPLLLYFGKSIYRDKKWAQFRENYQSAITDQ